MSNNRKTSLEDYTQVFKALANTNRLKIYLRLASRSKQGAVTAADKSGSLCVGELADEVDVVKSTVSHHIKELKRVGLIRTERQGQKIICWVDPAIMDGLRRFFTF